MPSELVVLVRVLQEAAALRTRRWVGAHLRREPVARLHTPSGIADPYPVYRQVRAAGPFLRLRSGDRVTARHGLCEQVLRSRDFGVVRPPGDAASATPTAGFDLGMLDRDPPDHTRLRRLVAPAFSARRIEAHRPLVDAAAARLLDGVGRSDQFDLVARYASPLPVTVITALLGVDSAEAAGLARHGAALSTALDGIRGLRHLLALQRASADLVAMFERLIDQRRQEPGDDVLSALVAAEGEGRLTGYELLVTCNLLLVAGFETTVNLLGNAVTALLNHPDQWAALRDDPNLAAAAVEETLRYDPPVQSTYRIAHVPVELAGERFAPGDGVMLLIGGAARDPAAYPDPDRFDLQRRPDAAHLAFSAGVHYCLGAPLARLEAEVGLRRLVERLPRLRRAGRARMRPASTIRGYAALPVRAS
jgi:cytochrome P450